VAHFGQIGGLVGSIANSAREQAVSIEQINVSMHQMDVVTQQNAAMAEESTAIAHMLAGESEELVWLTDRFRLDQRAGRAMAGPAPKRQRKTASA